MEQETIVTVEVEMEQLPFTFIEYTDEELQEMLDDNEDYREEEEFNRRGRWN
jgi:hypothetical protein